jgi:hypothetical protein
MKKVIQLFEATLWKKQLKRSYWFYFSSLLF